MKYTVRFAHLKTPSCLKEGEAVFSGDMIGTMGNTGQGKFNHLHLDCVRGIVDKIIRLKEIGYDGQDYTPDIKQLNYFIDSKLFKTSIVITTFFYEPDYKILYGKDHPAYDVVPIDRKETEEHFDIFWNRSKTGTVLKTGYDSGYGYYVLIGFEA